jgi:hypothetical protein
MEIIPFWFGFHMICNESDKLNSACHGLHETCIYLCITGPSVWYMYVITENKYNDDLNPLNTSGIPNLESSWVAELLSASKGLCFMELQLFFHVRYTVKAQLSSAMINKNNMPILTNSWERLLLQQDCSIHNAQHSLLCNRTVPYIIVKVQL